MPHSKYPGGKWERYDHQFGGHGTDDYPYSDRDPDPESEPANQNLPNQRYIEYKHPVALTVGGIAAVAAASGIGYMIYQYLSR